jgi:subtilisin family serine protease
MIKRILTAAGVVAIVSGVAASPALAAPGGAGSAGHVRQEASTRPLPRTGEWWISSWKILSRVWPQTEGAGVKVAVLDTGAQATVPDLRGAVLPGGDVTGRHTNGETDLNIDGDGHGTMMAVLIAGQGYGTRMVGVAPEAKILPVVINAAPADGTAGSAGSAATAAGIIYAANHGAQVIDVSQESVSPSASGCDAVEQAAVGYAVARNIVVVAAGGDTNLIGDRPSEPASCAGVLATVAVQPNRALWPEDAHQPYLTVANPGADLITSGRAGQLVTGVSGSRAASALAAGAVALIRSRYPAMPWYQVIKRVTGTALAAGGAVPNDAFGYGLFRLSRAVNATAYPLPASTPNPVYAKYRAWLATRQRLLGASQLAASQANKGGAADPALIAGVALLVIAGAGAGTALAGRMKLLPVRRGPRRNGARNLHGPRKQAPETTFPDIPAEATEHLGYPDFPYSRYSDSRYDNPADGDRVPLGEPMPYRIPPYTPAPVPRWDPSPEDGSFAPRL